MESCDNCYNLIWIINQWRCRIYWKLVFKCNPEFCSFYRDDKKNVEKRKGVIK